MRDQSAPPFEVEVNSVPQPEEPEFAPDAREKAVLRMREKYRCLRLCILAHRKRLVHKLDGKDKFNQYDFQMARECVCVIFVYEIRHAKTYGEVMNALADIRCYPRGLKEAFVREDYYDLWVTICDQLLCDLNQYFWGNGRLRLKPPEPWQRSRIYKPRRFKVNQEAASNTNLRG